MGIDFDGLLAQRQNPDHHQAVAGATGIEFEGLLALRIGAKWHQQQIGATGIKFELRRIHVGGRIGDSSHGRKRDCGASMGPTAAAGNFSGVTPLVLGWEIVLGRETGN